MDNSAIPCSPCRWLRYRLFRLAFVAPTHFGSNAGRRHAVPLAARVLLAVPWRISDWMFRVWGGNREGLN